MKKPRAGSPECGAIVASLPLSRTNRSILQQPFGFELTVQACLDSNQASATDPRPPNSSRTRRWHQCRAYTWGADHHADAPLLETRWDDPHASAEEVEFFGRFTLCGRQSKGADRSRPLQSKQVWQLGDVAR